MGSIWPGDKQWPEEWQVINCLFLHVLRADIRWIQAYPQHTLCSHLVVGCSIASELTDPNSQADLIPAQLVHEIHRVNLSSLAVTVSPFWCLHTSCACRLTQTHLAVKRWRPGSDADLSFDRYHCSTDHCTDGAYQSCHSRIGTTVLLDTSNNWSTEGQYLRSDSLTVGCGRNQPNWRCCPSSFQ